MIARKDLIFWPLAVGIVVADQVTKQLALDALAPRVPVPVLGDLLRFTLVFNRGAAMGISLGDASRWVFSAVAVGAVGLILSLLRQAPPAAILRPVILAMVGGGAVGNLIDRLRSAAGVVDFIDVGIGTARFWTFNVADIGVTCGTILLVWSLWEEDRART